MSSRTTYDCDTCGARDVTPALSVTTTAWVGDQPQLRRPVPIMVDLCASCAKAALQEHLTSLSESQARQWLRVFAPGVVLPEGGG